MKFIIWYLFYYLHNVFNSYIFVHCTKIMKKQEVYIDRHHRYSINITFISKVYKFIPQKMCLLLSIVCRVCNMFVKKHIFSKEKTKVAEEERVNQIRYPIILFWKIYIYFLTVWLLVDTTPIVIVIKLAFWK